MDLETQIKQIPDGRVQVVVQELYNRIKELESKKEEPYRYPKI